jgi:DhnA family fructose-bisphosphate aldolase class Ia
MTLKNKNTMAITVPADVPDYSHDKFVDNFTAVSCGTKNLFLFAADQKIEHLNNDFYGNGIHADANDPEHIFRIAGYGNVGALAAHAGLIARYGRQYRDINYIVKLNGKTNLGDQDPMSEIMWDVGNVLDLSDEGKLHIRGVGYTVYLGSAYEHVMLSQAAHVVTHAHNNGLLAILWIYIRGQHIKNCQTAQLIAGAAGLGNALGADFVKVHMPQDSSDMTGIDALKVATQAAGNTGVICSGGSEKPTTQLLTEIYEQINKGGARGCAIGRNIFQRSLNDAAALTKAIAALVYRDASLNDAINMISQQ